LKNESRSTFPEDLLGPSFWNSIRGRASCLQTGRVAPDVRESLLTTGLFELYLSSSQDLESGWAMLITDGLSRPPRTRTKDHHLDLKALRNAHRAGASLLLTRLQKRRPEIALVCRAIEEAFVRHGVVLSARVGANAYLTPPESRGFNVHNDGHDVIVLQLEGEKHWSLYGFAPTLPLEGDVTALKVPPEPKEELLLRPGDALYVPRGLLHGAEARASHSLHITFSIHVLTQRELIGRALDGIAALRRDAPAIGGPEEALEEYEGLARAAAAALQPERLRRAAIEASKEAMSNWEIIPDSHLRSAWRGAAPDAASEFQRAAGVFGMIWEDADGSMEVLCPGERIRGPQALRESLEFILGSRQAFTVADIPGPLTEGAKLELVQRLLDGGLLIKTARDD
jgi:cupin superfamily protein